MHLAVDSGFQLPIPVFVSGTWIWILIVSGRDSEFLELYCGFQSPGVLIPPAKFSQIPDSTFKNFLDSGIPIPLHGAS